jgi:hypothetical protein
MKSTIRDGWGILFNAQQHMLKSGDGEAANVLERVRVANFRDLMLGYTRKQFAE